MAKYRQLHTDFWNDGFVLDLTPEEKYFYIYLMTNSNTAQCGIYELPKRIIETQSGYNRETVDKLLKRFKEYKKIDYCEETKEIMIMNWVKYNQPNNINAVKCVNKELKDIKSRKFILAYYKQCMNYTLDMKVIFKDIDINYMGNKSLQGDDKPLIRVLEGACEEPASNKVISNKQKIINNKQQLIRNKEREEIRDNREEVYDNTIVQSTSNYTDISTAQVVEFFENSIYTLNPEERIKLINWCSFISCAVIVMAIEEAVMYNAKSLEYVEKVLNSWLRRGLMTPEAVKSFRWVQHSSSSG
ncbi:DnaD domain protein [Clostridium tyrobutyricum]|uniref:DnaD domain-containing protein n=2 Tax=Clostridium tyrobutyricum TaxID=1519 RepID=UPI001C3814C5|nr:DnaD domain protein [Clostridium tyrobutyricum]MBV4429517.1 DnaD domain protein [Clostridium tyrobutyricum]MBV4444738.1 DnaD domain protein [Clostridium tyrobutyricum]